MKKQILLLCSAFAISFNLSALTDAQAKQQGQQLMSGLVSGHNLAFGKDNLYKEALDLGMWNKAISNIKSFATTIMEENKNFLGMRDSTLKDALSKIEKADIDLVNAIKVTRGVLSSPANVTKQVGILNKIKTDMLNVQKSLKSSMSSVAKDEARKILNNTAMFIETTATKAIKDAQK